MQELPDAEAQDARFQFRQAEDHPPVPLEWNEIEQQFLDELEDAFLKNACNDRHEKAMDAAERQARLAEIAAIIATGPDHFYAIVQKLRTDPKYRDLMPEIEAIIVRYWGELSTIHGKLDEVSRPVTFRGERATATEPGPGLTQCTEHKGVQGCGRYYAKIRNHRNTCKGDPGATKTSVIDIFLYFLAFLLGFWREGQRDFSTVITFLCGYVVQGPLTDKAMRKFLQLLYATGLAESPISLSVMIANLRTRLIDADAIQQRIGQSAREDPGCFFTGKPSRSVFWDKVRPQVVRGCYCDWSWNPSGNLSWL
jgi:hypothetical protein